MVNTSRLFQQHDQTDFVDRSRHPQRLISPVFTPITGNITGSATTVAISEPTPITTPRISDHLSSEFSWSTTTPSTNTTATQSTFSAANFSSVTHTGAAAKETCYQLAQDHQEDANRRSLMRNAKLREQNVTIPSPYLESISFESGGVDPLYLTVRDSTGSTSYLDISNKSQIAISDRDGVAMKLDPHGIYFSSHDCRYDVSILVGDLLKQLAKLSGVECSTGGKLKKRLSDIPFVQGLTLHDQCDDPVGRSIRDYPKLSVGTSECVVMSIEESTGFWEFDCAFPGAESGTLQCQTAIKNDVVDFLTTDPFGGACPDLSTVITTLGTSGPDFLSKDSLRAELLKQGITDNDDPELDSILDSYQRAWVVLQAIFAKNSDGDSALELYLDLYNKYRDFATDVCEDLHAGEIPLDLTLEAGASRFVITTLNFAPEGSPPWNITVQDPAKEACCAHGSVAMDEREWNGTCGYPKEASIEESGCVCGKTTGGKFVAFEITECGNYVQSGCTSDQDCSDGGHSGFVCLTGTCCGSGVCIDPYACSDNSTQLVTYDPLFI
ncbi:nuclear condensin complex subunit Smc4 [Sarocladium implicatum]|nr:nuclear condensin complex subunit Smc4 [Sarocladium implicatum]